MALSIRYRIRTCRWRASSDVVRSGRRAGAVDRHSDLSDPTGVHPRIGSLDVVPFVSRLPDVGPPAPHPRLGAVCVGARPVLVAVNCQLAGDDPALAADIARPMNLVDLQATGSEAACLEVRHHARRLGSDVVAVERVGLLPAAELTRCTAGFRSWAGLGPGRTIEAHLSRRRPGRHPPP